MVITCTPSHPDVFQEYLSSISSSVLTGIPELWRNAGSLDQCLASSQGLGEAL